jgi:hypothetical protein
MQNDAGVPSGPGLPEEAVGPMLDYFLKKGLLVRIPGQPRWVRLTPNGRRMVALARRARPVREAKAIGLIRIPYPAVDLPSTSLADRETLLRRAALAEGAELIETIFEIGAFRGARLKERDGPRKVVEAIRSGRASVVVIIDDASVVASDLEATTFRKQIAAAGGRVVQAH